MIISLLERTRSIPDVIKQNPVVFRQAFKNCKLLKIHQVETLIIKMAKLQASFHFEEPPISMYCKELVDIYVDHYRKSKSESRYAETVVPKIENVLHYAEVSGMFYPSKFCLIHVKRNFHLILLIFAFFINKF